MVATSPLVGVPDNVESWVAKEAVFVCFRLSKRALQASLYQSTVYTVLERRSFVWCLIEGTVLI